MAVPDWTPPPRADKRIVPSPKFVGAEDVRQLFSYVGLCLSGWEKMETVLAKLFQVLCEAPSPAARRAYGTLTSSIGRKDALKAAATVFCKRNDDSDASDELDGLFKAYNDAMTYRNDVAHGMMIAEPINKQWCFYIAAPEYTTKKRIVVESLDDLLEVTIEQIGHESIYYYRIAELSAIADRFTQLEAEAMRLLLYLDGKYTHLEWL